MKEYLFCIVVLIHILVWGFIMFAFIDKRTAHVNLYYVIPALYILHILPFHLLIELKKSMYTDDWEDRDTQISKTLVIPHLHKKCSKFLDNFCTFNPMSPQGMMIFGLITCVYRLYPISFKEDYEHVKNIF